MVEGVVLSSNPSCYMCNLPIKKIGESKSCYSIIDFTPTFRCHLASWTHISLGFISMILPSLLRNSCFMCHPFWAIYKSSLLNKILNIYGSISSVFVYLCQVQPNPKSAATTICIFNNCTTNTYTSGTTFTIKIWRLMFAVTVGLSLFSPFAIPFPCFFFFFEFMFLLEIIWW